MRRKRVIDIVPSVQSMSARDPETGSSASFIKCIGDSGGIEYVCTGVDGALMSGKFEVHARYSTPSVVSALSSLMGATAAEKCSQAELVMLFDEDTRKYFERQ